MLVGELAADLLPHESVVWRGAPEAGVRVRLVDVPLIVFGAFFTLVSLAFVIPLFPLGLLLPHFWIGLYFLVGRFFVDSKIRAATTYAVTDSRALIVRTWPLRRSSSVNLDTVAEIAMTHHRDGTSTITFGPHHGPFTDVTWGFHRPASFEAIRDGRHVMELVHQPHLRRSAPTT